MTTIEDARQASTWDDAEQQRPAKKRRFFVEDSPDKPTLNADIAQRGGSVALEDHKTQERLPHLRQNGFDIDMIETVVGQQLDDDTLNTLYLLADKEVETGMSASSIFYGFD